MLYTNVETNVRVAAVQYKGDNIKEVVNLANRHVYQMNDPFGSDRIHVIDTPDGLQKLMINDWIVEKQGTYHQYKPDEFNDKYIQLST